MTALVRCQEFLSAIQGADFGPEPSAKAKAHDWIDTYALAMRHVLEEHAVAIRTITPVVEAVLASGNDDEISYYRAAWADVVCSVEGTSNWWHL